MLTHSLFASGSSCSMRMREVNSLAYSINQQMSTTTLALLLQRDVYVYQCLSRCSSVDVLILSMVLFCLPLLNNQQEDRFDVCLSLERLLDYHWSSTRSGSNSISLYQTMKSDLFFLSKQCDRELSFRCHRSVTVSKCTPYSSFLGGLILKCPSSQCESRSFVLFKRREEKEKERNQTLQCMCMWAFVASFSLNAFAWTRERKIPRLIRRLSLRDDIGVHMLEQAQSELFLFNEDEMSRFFSSSPSSCIDKVFRNGDDDDDAAEERERNNLPSIFRWRNTWLKRNVLIKRTRKKQSFSLFVNLVRT